ncbi:hypothetical protein BJ322DRAFT_1063691 [Thelephora terrestris]|uniref:Pre-rRNA-processing protein n=1 Tax=Thelephora terrestris TaxID=56493 RepID=A0A9P6HEY9_9AGAM|nr:hypothetical protein BJ322DRAFT_1063691 [Thelephora terrestris]
MPKSTKKKKEKVADFTKAKLKLGKGKKQPTNAVDTTFKARSIALPSQSITIDKSNEVHTTKRKQTFEDLISHLKHHNPNTRKDAIFGLRELLDTYPTLIPQLLTPLVTATVRLMSDEDQTIRQTLLSVYRWLMPLVPSDNLLPHASLILLFTTSAQTHIFPDIRLDAVRFVDVFLERMPNIVVTGWYDDTSAHGARVLDGYLGLLSAGTKFGEEDGETPQATSTASVVLSLASKLVVLKSLATFLRHALSPSRNRNESSSSCSSWYMASSFTSARAHRSGPSNVVWKPEALPPEEQSIGTFPLADVGVGDGFSLQELSDLRSAVCTESGTSSRRLKHISRLAHTLHPIVVATFLDCAPAAFGLGSTNSTELELITNVADISRSLYGAILQGESLETSKRDSDELSVLLGHMAVYFPFAANGGKRDIKVEQTLQGLNLIFCELTSLLTLRHADSPFPTSGSRNHKSKGKTIQKSTSVASLPFDRVKGYVSRLLAGEAHSTDGLSRPLALDAYSALLPTLWSLVNNVDGNSGGGVGEETIRVVVDHAMRIGSMGASKRATVEFVGRLMLLRTEREYTGSFRSNLSKEVEEKFEEWAKHIPKTLWELGANNLDATELIARFLSRLFQRKACRPETTKVICARFTPYFTITHPTRGALPGPFFKLPAAHRRLMLDVAVTMLDDRDVRAAAAEFLSTVEKSLAGQEDKGYWDQISRRRHPAGRSHAPSGQASSSIATPNISAVSNQ